MTAQTDSGRWRKSTRSGGEGGDCVEVADLEDGRVGVCDSKDHDGPVLVFRRAAWVDFLVGVGKGEFDMRPSADAARRAP